MKTTFKKYEIEIPHPKGDFCYRVIAGSKVSALRKAFEKFGTESYIKIHTIRSL